MSGRIVWLNDYTWHRVSYDTRRRVKKVLGELPENYAANIENSLRIRGEHKLADAVIDELEQ